MRRMEDYDYNYANYIFYCRYVGMKVTLAANNYSEAFTHLLLVSLRLPRSILEFCTKLATLWIGLIGLTRLHDKSHNDWLRKL